MIRDSSVKAKKTIKLAVLESRYGGAVTSVNDLVIGLDRDRFEVIFLYLRKGKTLVNHLEQQGFRTITLSHKKSLRTFDFGALLKLVRVLKRHDIDLLHCHAHKATVYGALAGMFVPRLRIVAHVHGLRRSARVRRKLTNLAVCWRIQRFLPVAQAVKLDLIQSNWALSPSKATVLENSIDYARFALVGESRDPIRQEFGLAPDAFIFASIGRLAPTKGLDYLIEAFSQISPTEHKTHLLLVGEGRERQRCERRVRELALGNHVHFAGFRRDIEPFFHAMDAFVIASIAEGMPRVLLEAMAARKPCIGTSVGGIPEVIDASFGLVVEPADSRSLARAMQQLRSMEAHQRAAWGRNAQQKAESQYAHTVVREKLQAIYLELLQ